MGKVLLIIANRKVTDEMTAMLKLDGHEIVSTDSELAGKSLVVRENPDLVIIDSSMGDNAVKEIKESFPDLTMLGWMLERNARLVVDMMIAGVIDCLCSPLRAAEVIGVANHAMGKVEVKKDGTRFMLPYINYWKHKKSILLGILAVLVLINVWIFFPDETVKELKLPYTDPTSVTASGFNLWIGDWFTQSIYFYTDKNGIQLADNYYFENFGPVSLAIDGGYLWSAGNDLKLRKHVIDDNMVIIRNYNLKKHSPSGIAVSEGYLWLSDSAAGKIYQYGIGDTLTLVNAYSHMVSQPVGFTWDGELMWLADAQTNRLYSYEKKGKNLKKAKVYEIPQNDNTVSLAGMSVWEKYVYLVYSGKSAKLLKYKISTLKEYKTKKKKK